MELLELPTSREVMEEVANRSARRGEGGEGRRTTREEARGQRRSEATTASSLTRSLVNSSLRRPRRAGEGWGQVAFTRPKQLDYTVVQA